MTEIRSNFLPWLQYLWRRFNDDQCMRSAGKKPLLLKALGALYLLWQHQQRGESLAKAALLDHHNPDTHDLDNGTWCGLRHLFLQHKLILIDEKGHYLLARDLHKVSYCQLKEWLNGEVATINEAAAEGSWQYSGSDSVNL